MSKLTKRNSRKSKKEPPNPFVIESGKWYAFEIYPESASVDNAVAFLRPYVDFYAYILHNADLNELGELKKEHIHFMFRSSADTTLETHMRFLKVSVLVAVADAPAYANYLTHSTPDAMNKHQYPPSDINTSNRQQLDYLRAQYGKGAGVQYALGNISADEAVHKNPSLVYSLKNLHNTRELLADAREKDACRDALFAENIRLREVVLRLSALAKLYTTTKNIQWAYMPAEYLQSDEDFIEQIDQTLNYFFERKQTK